MRVIFVIMRLGSCCATIYWNLVVNYHLKNLHSNLFLVRNNYCFFRLLLLSSKGWHIY